MEKQKLPSYLKKYSRAHLRFVGSLYSLPFLVTVFPVRCQPDIASPSRPECSMQSPIQKANKYRPRTNKETKSKSLVRTYVSELMETLQCKKGHLLSSTSSARTAAFLKHRLFWLAHRQAQKGMLVVCLVRAHKRKERQ